MDIGADKSIRTLIQLAKEEDLGAGDVTTALMANAQQPAEFKLLAKQGGVLSGREIGEAVLREYDATQSIEWHGVEDGSSFVRGTTLATLRGPLGSLLAAERVFLNFFQRLCGVATSTRAYVREVEGTKAVICDTRKTTPGWRVLEKYAVRCGGGVNHRDGLYDAVLIKDNHLAGVPDERLSFAVFDMLNRLPPEAKPKFVEVEAQSLSAFAQLLKVVGIDIILLDNFSIEELAKAVELREAEGLAEKVQLEASGGISLKNVRAVAETGVERISVGAITHSAAAIDLALERV